jgi:hypothetical protein
VTPRRVIPVIGLLLVVAYIAYFVVQNPARAGIILICTVILFSGLVFLNYIFNCIEYDSWNPRKWEKNKK